MTIQQEQQLLDSTRRVKPNRPQVEKIRKQLDQLTGLNMNKKIDYVFDGINKWEQGYNLATITLAFYPDRSEYINDIEYPRRDTMYDMKVNLRVFRNSTQCKRLVLYPSRGPDGKGEWRYFNMQQIDEFDLVKKMDLAVIRALKRWIKHITTILKNDPEERNDSHKKQVSEIRYELMLRRRILKQLEKRNLKKIKVSDGAAAQEGELESNETDEK